MSHLVKEAANLTRIEQRNKPDFPAKTAQLLRKAGVEALQKYASYLPQKDQRSISIAAKETRVEAYSFMYYVYRFFSCLPHYENAAELEFYRDQDSSKERREMKRDLLFAELFHALTQTFFELFKNIVLMPVVIEESLNEQETESYKVAVDMWRKGALGSQSELSHEPFAITVTQTDVDKSEALKQLLQDWDVKHNELVNNFKMLSAALQLLDLNKEQREAVKAFLSEVPNFGEAWREQVTSEFELFFIRFSSHYIPSVPIFDYASYLNRVHKENSLKVFLNKLAAVKNEATFVSELFIQRDLRMLDLSNVELQVHFKALAKHAAAAGINGPPKQFNDYGRSILDGVSFKNAKISGVSFEKGLLMGADFSLDKQRSGKSRSLSDISFEEDPLVDDTMLSVDVNFSGADCRGANFNGRIFEKPNFRYAKLQAASFFNVTFNEADFSGANLTGVKRRLFYAPGDTATVNKETILPSGEPCDIDGLILLEDLFPLLPALRS